QHEKCSFSAPSSVAKKRLNLVWPMRVFRWRNSKQQLRNGRNEWLEIQKTRSSLAKLFTTWRWTRWVVPNNSSGAPLATPWGRSCRLKKTNLTSLENDGTKAPRPHIKTVMKRSATRPQKTINKYF